ncbi:MAG: enoyl-CoA hydratase-related protein [Anaerolineae bacterium]
MKYDTLKIERRKSVVRVNLHRPEARNAMNRQMVCDLLDYFTAIGNDRSIRVVVLGGDGPVFCAGGDIKEMQSAATGKRKTRLRPFSEFDAMLAAVNRAPQVVIARIHSAAMGGGLGLVCVADMAVAAHEAILAFPEVRLGLVPAVIAPYVVARIGLTQARRLMLTGAHLDGKQAAEVGLVTLACPINEINSSVNELVNAVLQAPSAALAACKKLLLEVSSKPSEETAAYRADLLRELQSGEAGQEGMRAFLEKRPPKWLEKVEE